MFIRKNSYIRIDYGRCIAENGYSLSWVAQTAKEKLNRWFIFDITRANWASMSFCWYWLCSLNKIPAASDVINLSSFIFGSYHLRNLYIFLSSSTFAAVLIFLCKIALDEVVASWISSVTMELWVSEIGESYCEEL